MAKKGKQERNDALQTGGGRLYPQFEKKWLDMFTSLEREVSKMKKTFAAPFESTNTASYTRRLQCKF